MHVDTAPYDNNDVRLALKYAVDRDELNEKILKWNRVSRKRSSY